MVSSLVKDICFSLARERDGCSIDCEGLWIFHVIFSYISINKFKTLPQGHWWKRCWEYWGDYLGLYTVGKYSSCCR
jgi:hypothetical protein